MALGGGTWITQSKILPGSYINFVSASRASAALSERGIATMPLELSWGPDGEVFTVTAEAFQKDSIKIFGYPYTHEALKGLRDLFIHIKTGYFYKLNSGGAKASNSYATALYTGARGNSLRVVIEAAEESTEEAPVYDVSTYLDSTLVDVQTVSQASQLKDNDFLTFKSDATLALTAGAPLTGGTDGTVQNAAYQLYLDKMESYSFNTMGCLSTDATVKRLFINFTRRLRDDCGVKFQTVLFRPQSADYEGIIGVENGLAEDDDDPSLVYWTTGAQAGCAVNKSRTNAAYTGEFSVAAGYTQAELTAGIQAGKFMFHQVNGQVRVLEDINTFVSFTDEKSADFSSNQTMRVLDQLGNDDALLFNTKYLGQMPNDESGRISLWNDLVKLRQELQKLRAIENFVSEDLTVQQGETKKSVVTTGYVTPVNAMAQLYMTVVVA